MEVEEEEEEEEGGTILKSSPARLADWTREIQFCWSMGPRICVEARRFGARGPADDRMWSMEATVVGEGGEEEGKAAETA